MGCCCSIMCITVMVGSSAASNLAQLSLYLLLSLEGDLGRKQGKKKEKKKMVKLVKQLVIKDHQIPSSIGLL